ncbi:hypothetical protein H696_03142 [Fonticula alba]|uniref:Uncharacterized protein n=1 Tax=Fonticula alba TaxID=691883 RepID=A0A058Z9K1_FONAL|nr:hypothetical protein H696_03142 [Fonticula alba]KCV70791.1 hypothetical protein H696_03142 [Fonticula alba]|eukprot:XP_009495307.1 hypothetical protein H696_03142 [Fonticula alba]
MFRLSRLATSNFSRGSVLLNPLRLLAVADTDSVDDLPSSLRRRFASRSRHNDYYGRDHDYDDHDDEGDDDIMSSSFQVDDTEEGVALSSPHYPNAEQATYLKEAVAWRRGSRILPKESMPLPEPDVGTPEFHQFVANIASFETPPTYSYVPIGPITFRQAIQSTFGDYPSSIGQIVSLTRREEYLYRPSAATVFNAADQYRSVMLEGPVGSGKSIVLFQALQRAWARGDVVVYIPDPHKFAFMKYQFYCSDNVATSSSTYRFPRMAYEIMRDMYKLNSTDPMGNGENRLAQIPLVRTRQIEGTTYANTEGFDNLADYIGDLLHRVDSGDLSFNSIELADSFHVVMDALSQKLPESQRISMLIDRANTFFGKLEYRDYQGKPLVIGTGTTPEFDRIHNIFSGNEQTHNISVIGAMDTRTRGIPATLPESLQCIRVNVPNMDRREFGLMAMKIFTGDYNNVRSVEDPTRTYVHRLRLPANTCSYFYTKTSGNPRAGTLALAVAPSTQTPEQLQRNFNLRNALYYTRRNSTREYRRRLMEEYFQEYPLPVYARADPLTGRMLEHEPGSSVPNELDYVTSSHDNQSVSDSSVHKRHKLNSTQKRLLKNMDKTSLSIRLARGGLSEAAGSETEEVATVATGPGSKKKKGKAESKSASARREATIAFLKDLAAKTPESQRIHYPPNFDVEDDDESAAREEALDYVLDVLEHYREFPEEAGEGPDFAEWLREMGQLYEYLASKPVAPFSSAPRPESNGAFQQVNLASADMSTYGPLGQPHEFVIQSNPLKANHVLGSFHFLQLPDGIWPARDTPLGDLTATSFGDYTYDGLVFRPGPGTDAGVPRDLAVERADLSGLARPNAAANSEIDAEAEATSAAIGTGPGTNPYWNYNSALEDGEVPLTARSHSFGLPDGVYDPFAPYRLRDAPRIPDPRLDLPADGEATGGAEPAVDGDAPVSSFDQQDLWYGEDEHFQQAMRRAAIFGQGGAALLEERDHLDATLKEVSSSSTEPAYTRKSLVEFLRREAPRHDPATFQRLLPFLVTVFDDLHSTSGSAHTTHLAHVEEAAFEDIQVFNRLLDGVTDDTLLSFMERLVGAQSVDESEDQLLAMSPPSWLLPTLVTAPRPIREQMSALGQKERFQLNYLLNHWFMNDCLTSAPGRFEGSDAWNRRSGASNPMLVSLLDKALPFEAYTSPTDRARALRHLLTGGEGAPVPAVLLKDLTGKGDTTAQSQLASLAAVAAESDDLGLYLNLARDLARRTAAVSEALARRETLDASVRQMALVLGNSAITGDTHGLDRGSAGRVLRGNPLDEAGWGVDGAAPVPAGDDRPVTAAALLDTNRQYEALQALMGLAQSERDRLVAEHDASKKQSGRLPGNARSTPAYLDNADFTGHAEEILSASGAGAADSRKNGLWPTDESGALRAPVPMVPPSLTFAEAVRHSAKFAGRFDRLTASATDFLLDKYTGPVVDDPQHMAIAHPDYMGGVTTPFRLLTERFTLASRIINALVAVSKNYAPEAHILPGDYAESVMTLLEFLYERQSPELVAGRTPVFLHSAFAALLASDIPLPVTVAADTRPLLVRDAFNLLQAIGTGQAIESSGLFEQGAPLPAPAPPMPGNMSLLHFLLGVESPVSLDKFAPRADIDPSQPAFSVRDMILNHRTIFEDESFSLEPVSLVDVLAETLQDQADPRGSRSLPTRPSSTAAPVGSVANALAAAGHIDAGAAAAPRESFYMTPTEFSMLAGAQGEILFEDMYHLPNPFSYDHTVEDHEKWSKYNVCWSNAEAARKMGIARVEDILQSGQALRSSRELAARSDSMADRLQRRVDDSAAREAAGAGAAAPPAAAPEVEALLDQLSGPEVRNLSDLSYLAEVDLAKLPSRSERLLGRALAHRLGQTGALASRDADFEAAFFMPTDRERALPRVNKLGLTCLSAPTGPRPTGALTHVNLQETLLPLLNPQPEDFDPWVSPFPADTGVNSLVSDAMVRPASTVLPATGLPKVAKGASMAVQLPSLPAYDLLSELVLTPPAEVAGVRDSHAPRLVNSPAPASGRHGINPRPMVHVPVGDKGHAFPARLMAADAFVGGALYDGRPAGPAVPLEFGRYAKDGSFEPGVPVFDPVTGAEVGFQAGHFKLVTLDRRVAADPRAHKLDLSNPAAVALAARTPGEASYLLPSVSVWKHLHEKQVAPKQVSNMKQQSAILTSHNTKAQAQVPGRRLHDGSEIFVPGFALADRFIPGAVTSDGAHVRYGLPAVLLAAVPSLAAAASGQPGRMATSNQLEAAVAAVQADLTAQLYSSGTPGGPTVNKVLALSDQAYAGLPAGDTVSRAVLTEATRLLIAQMPASAERDEQLNALLTAGSSAATGPVSRSLAAVLAATSSATGGAGGRALLSTAVPFAFTEVVPPSAGAAGAGSSSAALVPLVPAANEVGFSSREYRSTEELSRETAAAKKNKASSALLDSSTSRPFPEISTPQSASVLAKYNFGVPATPDGTPLASKAALRPFSNLDLVDDEFVEGTFDMLTGAFVACRPVPVAHLDILARATPSKPVHILRHPALDLGPDVAFVLSDDPRHVLAADAFNSSVVPFLPTVSRLQEDAFKAAPASIKTALATAQAGNLKK